MQTISPCLKRKLPTPDEVRPGLIPAGPTFENDESSGRAKKLCAGPRVAFKEEAKVRCHSVDEEEDIPASRSDGDEWQEFVIRTKDHDGISRDAAVVWRLLLSVFNPCQGTLVDRLLELYYTNQVQLLLDAHARVLKMIESIHRTGKTGIVCASCILDGAALPVLNLIAKMILQTCATMLATNAGMINGLMVALDGSMMNQNSCALMADSMSNLISLSSTQTKFF